MAVEQREMAKFANDFRTAQVFEAEQLAVYTCQSAELEREIIGLFLTQISDVALRLKNTEQYSEWKSIVHTLKGAALTIGALRLAEVAKVLEVPEIYENKPLRLELLVYLGLAVHEFKRQVTKLYTI